MFLMRYLYRFIFGIDWWNQDENFRVLIKIFKVVYPGWIADHMAHCAIQNVKINDCLNCETVLGSLGDAIISPALRDYIKYQEMFKLYSHFLELQELRENKVREFGEWFGRRGSGLDDGGQSYIPIFCRNCPWWTLMIFTNWTLRTSFISACQSIRWHGWQTS